MLVRQNADMRLGTGTHQGVGAEDVVRLNTLEPVEILLHCNMNLRRQLLLQGGPSRLTGDTARLHVNVAIQPDLTQCMHVYLARCHATTAC